MADIILPPHLKVARNRFRYISGAAGSRGLYSGALQSAALGGDRVAASLDMRPAKNRLEYAERSASIAWIMSLGGPLNRVWMPDHSHTRRGSFPATELISNNTFESGTTGWTAAGTGSVSDRVYRSTRILFNGANNEFSLMPSANITGLTQYAPYVQRYFVRQGRGAYTGGLYVFDNVASLSLGSSTTFGMITGSLVVTGTTARPCLLDNASSGGTAGDFIEIPYASMSRCALIDNGQNALLFSDQFDNAAWTKTATTISANTGLTFAPDGTATADNIVETSANSAHYVSQAATVGAGVHDRCFTIALKTNGRSHCILQMEHATGAVSAYFNLSTGAVGNVSTGTGWANLRTFASDMGNGWWQFSIVASKTTSATSVTVAAQLATANGTGSYTGSASFGMFAWRGTLAPSSVPVRLALTTSVTTVGANQTGSGLHLKGLPASTSGLLLPGDWAEVVHSQGSSLHMTTAALNSDASGLGYWQFSPPIRRSPADNSPVIINQPMGRFSCVSELPEWATDPGIISTVSLDFEEA